MAGSSPLRITASTTTPRHSTNARNGTSTALAIAVTVVRPVLSARAPSTSAPASAAHAGDSPNREVTAKPASVRPTTTSAKAGTSIGSVCTSRCGAIARSFAKNQRNKRNSTTMAASQGRDMAAAKCRNDSPAALKANRLVRFDTGSSSDAVLARCAVA